MFKNLFCLYKNLNLEFTLFITCVAIDSSESVSSRMQPKRHESVEKFYKILIEIYKVSYFHLKRREFDHESLFQ